MLLEYKRLNGKNDMERKIGEIFKYDNDWYQCIEGVCGKDCSLYGNSLRKTIADITEQAFGVCNSNHRSDDKSVIFKKLEKVGEPIKINGKLVLRVKADADMCMGCCFYSKAKCELTMEECEYYNCGEGTKFVEIKNKEDMEEKAIKIKKEDIKIGNKVICLSNNKPYVITEANCRMKYDGDWHDCVIYTPLYNNPFKCFVRPIKDFAQNFVLDSTEEKEEKLSNLENTGKNLKPFDLEAAKAGKPVCTRDGRKARIICFDRDWDMHIVALVADPLGESVHYYLSNGKVDFDRQLDDDLMMLPEKKEGWVNVYYNKIDGITFSKHPHTSKEEAIKEAGGTLSGRIDTVKISWEE